MLNTKAPHLFIHENNRIMAGQASKGFLGIREDIPATFHYSAAQKEDLFVTALPDSFVRCYQGGNAAV